MFDIPPLLFFRSKNPFTGSRGLFRFLIQPGETLAVQVWRGPFCYEKSEILETAGIMEAVGSTFDAYALVYESFSSSSSKRHIFGIY